MKKTLFAQHYMAQ